MEHLTNRGSSKCAPGTDYLVLSLHEGIDVGPESPIRSTSIAIPSTQLYEDDSRPLKSGGDHKS